MPVQYYEFVLSIESIIIKDTYLHCWLKKDLPDIHFFFPVRCSFLHHKDLIRNSQKQGDLIIYAFPAYAAWLGLTATM